MLIHSVTSALYIEILLRTLKWLVMQARLKPFHPAFQNCPWHTHNLKGQVLPVPTVPIISKSQWIEHCLVLMDSCQTCLWHTHNPKGTSSTSSNSTYHFKIAKNSPLLGAYGFLWITAFHIHKFCPEPQNVRQHRFEQFKPALHPNLALLIIHKTLKGQVIVLQGPGRNLKIYIYIYICSQS